MHPTGNHYPYPFLHTFSMSEEDIQEVSSSSFLELCPREVLHHILEFLPPCEIHTVIRRLNKGIKDLASSTDLWVSHLLKRHDLVDLLYLEPHVIAERRSKGRVQRGRMMGTKKKFIVRTVSLETTNAGRDDGVPTSCLREVSLLSKILHPNLVICYGAKVIGSHIQIVSEYIERNLSSYISCCSGEQLNRDVVNGLMKQLFSAVECLHQKGIIHRNIKPDNIFLITSSNDSALQLKLGDLAMARLIDIPLEVYTPEDPKERDRSYREQRRLYNRAPELILRQPVYGVEVDMWSIGCIFVELALGFPPFRCESEIGLLLATLQLCGTPDVSIWNCISASSRSFLKLPVWNPIDFRAVAASIVDPKTRELGHLSPYLVGYCKQVDAVKMLLNVGLKMGVSSLHLLERLTVIPGCFRISATEALSYPYFTHSSEDTHMHPEVQKWIESFLADQAIHSTGLVWDTLTISDNTIPSIAHYQRFIGYKKDREQYLLLNSTGLNHQTSNEFWNFIRFMEERWSLSPLHLSLYGWSHFDYHEELTVQQKTSEFFNFGSSSEQGNLIEESCDDLGSPPGGSNLAHNTHSKWGFPRSLSVTQKESQDNSAHSPNTMNSTFVNLFICEVGKSERDCGRTEMQQSFRTKRPHSESASSRHTPPICQHPLMSPYPRSASLLPLWGSPTTQQHYRYPKLMTLTPSRFQSLTLHSKGACYVFKLDPYLRLHVVANNPFSHHVFRQVLGAHDAVVVILGRDRTYCTCFVYISLLTEAQKENKESISVNDAVSIAIATLKIADLNNEISKEYYKQDNIGEYTAFFVSCPFSIPQQRGDEDQVCNISLTNTTVGLNVLCVLIKRAIIDNGFVLKLVTCGLLETEKRILNAVHFDIAIPTVYWFLNVFLAITKLLHMSYLVDYCYYLADLCLYSHHMVCMRPSLKAQVVLLFSCCSLFRPTTANTRHENTTEITLEPGDSDYPKYLTQLLSNIYRHRDVLCAENTVWTVLHCVVVMRDLLINGRRYFEVYGPLQSLCQHYSASSPPNKTPSFSPYSEYVGVASRCFLVRKTSSHSFG